jgi:hypothetical protein
MFSTDHAAPRTGARRVIVSMFACLALLLAMTASAAAVVVPQGWHRLNVHSDPAEHERFACLTNDVWRCRYDKVPEPTLGLAWDQTRGSFTGTDTTAAWECPDWFPSDACADADTVISGTTDFLFPRASGGFSVSQQLLVGDDGDLWIYWGDDFQFVCPWYTTFAEATPDNSSCTFL